MIFKPEARTVKVQVRHTRVGASFSGASLLRISGFQSGTFCSPSAYSYLRVTIGSTRMARRAGM